MHKKRISIIDLGTNTFNLLVAECDFREAPKILYRSKYPTKTGKGGMNNNFITKEAFERARIAFKEVSQISKQFEVEERLVFATSAIRTADNGGDFVQMLQDEFQFKTEIISGEREAELIYYGIKNEVKLSHDPVAILDIGGGSNEIIIANHEKIFWKKSYPLGVTRLLEKFTPSDPITKSEILKIELYLKEQLPGLLEVLELHQVKTLIGSSGSFDTLKQILIEEEYVENPLPEVQFEIKLKHFFNLHQRFLASNTQERKNMKGMDPERVELMPVASIFTNYLIKEGGFSKLYYSACSLKEGALFEYIEKEKMQMA